MEDALSCLRGARLVRVLSNSVLAFGIQGYRLRGAAADGAQLKSVEPFVEYWTPIFAVGRLSGVEQLGVAGKSAMILCDVGCIAAMLPFI